MLWRWLAVLIPALMLGCSWMWINRATTPDAGNLALAGLAASVLLLALGVLSAAG